MKRQEEESSERTFFSVAAFMDDKTASVSHTGGWK